MISEPRVEVCFLATSSMVFLLHLVKTFFGGGWGVTGGGADGYAKI